MTLAIKPLQKKDYHKAISFAVTGMNFNRYTENKFLLKLYGRYFWDMELSRASQVIAAYCGDRLVGVLLADISGEPKRHTSISGKAYVKFIDFVQNVFYRNCTYQFYEHRGFERAGEKQISLTFSDKDKVPLSCYLYTKVCGRDGKTNDR